MSDTLPPLPEPRTLSRGDEDGAIQLGYTADQMRSYAAAALAAAEPVASVTECEACFTPDVCQLRGTCDHYAAERLRVAAPPQREREPVHQWRKRLCAEWYDGHPDHDDGGGPYETRTLYAAPKEQT